MSYRKPKVLASEMPTVQAVFRNPETVSEILARNQRMPREYLEILRYVILKLKLEHRQSNEKFEGKYRTLRYKLKSLGGSAYPVWGIEFTDGQKTESLVLKRAFTSLYAIGYQYLEICKQSPAFIDRFPKFHGVLYGWAIAEYCHGYEAVRDYAPPRKTASRGREMRVFEDEGFRSLYAREIFLLFQDLAVHHVHFNDVGCFVEPFISINNFLDEKSARIKLVEFGNLALDEEYISPNQKLASLLICEVSGLIQCKSMGHYLPRKKTEESFEERDQRVGDFIALTGGIPDDRVDLLFQLYKRAFVTYNPEDLITEKGVGFCVEFTKAVIDNNIETFRQYIVDGNYIKSIS